VADHLFIRIAENPDQASIVALNADGQLLTGPESVSLTMAASRAEGMQVTVLLPARDFVCCVAKMPAASPSRLRQMLPFSLEDEFAGDVEELHFAAGDRNDAEALAVSVIAKARLDTWLDALRSAGISARRVCSESDAVPDTPGVVTLFLEGRKIMGRRPAGAPFLFEELTLSALWQLLRAEQESTDDLDNVVLFIDPNTLRERKAEIDAWRQTVANLDVKELAAGCLPRLAAGLVHRSGTNLLQGQYAPRSNYAALARPWRTAAGFLLVLVTVVIVGKGALYWKLSQDDSRLQMEIDAICAAAYGSSQTSACRLEMQRRLAASGRSASGNRGGFLPTLSVIAEASEDSMLMENLAYREGVVSLELIAPDVGYLDAFDQGVSRAGDLEVRIQATTPEANGVKTRLQIVPLIQ
jgi:general secretion pathway protein L